MQSLDALNLLPVWVNPEHLSATAKIILAGHRLKVLGVVDGSELVGIITASDTNSKADQTKVREFMLRADRTVEASTPLLQLAETFWSEDLDFLPVVQGDKFLGIVTPNMLLKEMSHSWDPLTGLSWSDSLREWGVEHLKNGSEITILFIDLDDFGSYNKKYGHIVGDRVLQRVAELIQAHIEPGRDLLVRYGGDEFAIGTIRDQGEAAELAATLKGAIDLRVAGSDEPVTFCIGVQGGKRTKERENVHYAATLDNLINMASKNCVAQKASKKQGVVTSEPVGEDISPETAADIAESQVAAPLFGPDLEVVEFEPFSEDSDVLKDEFESEEPAVNETIGPINITEVIADPADANSVIHVTVMVGDLTVTGVCPRKGGSVLRSVAVATVNAISQLRPSIQMDVREVNLTESENGVRFISVIGVGMVNGEEHPIGGVGTVGRSLYMTVAEATAQAYTNLQIILENS